MKNYLKNFLKNLLTGLIFIVAMMFIIFFIAIGIYCAIQVFKKMLVSNGLTAIWNFILFVGDLFYLSNILSFIGEIIFFLTND